MQSVTSSRNTPEQTKSCVLAQREPHTWLNLFLLSLVNHSWNAAIVKVEVEDKDPVLWLWANTPPSRWPGEEGLPHPGSRSLTSPLGYLQSICVALLQLIHSRYQTI